MAISLAPTDWRLPQVSTAPMDHQAKQTTPSSGSSSSKSGVTSPAPPPSTGPARHDSPNNSEPRSSPSQASDPSKATPSVNGQFVPYPMPPQPSWSPQQQPGFGYPAMYGYFPQQQAPFAPFDPQQQPNPQQFAQWAAYQQMFFNAQQQQQHLAAAVAAGMMPRQRTGSSPQAPPDLTQAFLIGGQLPSNMVNNGAFPMMAFPNGAGTSGASSARGSAASEPSNNQSFHPYRRTRGSPSTSSTGTPASSSPSSVPPNTIAGLPPSAFPPLQAVQPPYARQRTNSASSANSSRSSRSGAGGNRPPATGRSASFSNAPLPAPAIQLRSVSSPSSSNGRSAPTQTRSPDPSRPSGTKGGSSTTGTASPPPVRDRTLSNASSSSSPPPAPADAPALPTVSAQNPTGSVRSRAPPRPSPLSQQPSISAESTAATAPTPTPSNASKRLSKDDSELKAYGESPHVHAPRSAGLKGRIRRALSLAPSGTLCEEDGQEQKEKLGSRKAVVAAKSKTEQATATTEGKMKAAALPQLPATPTTPSSAHSGSTIGASSPLTPPGSTGDAHDDNVSDAPPDPSIRSTKHKKSKSGSLFNRKWNASTDNISLSSTVSSASLMIRKIGSVGALARRKSLTGVTNLFKGKKKDKDSKSGASTSISQVHAEVDHGELESGSDDMMGLSPAAKLARQHTLRSNAEAAARAKQQELLRQQQDQHQRQAASATSSLLVRHVRNISEDGSEDGFTHISYGGRPRPRPHAEEEDDGEEDDEDATVRHESLDIEVEPWAINVRRSIERTRMPSRGILKYASTYKQEEDLKLSRSHSLSRSRANSYDTVSINHRSHEPGPLARIPSADPDHIDGLQSSQSGSDDFTGLLLPPLNLTDIYNFSDSPVSSSTNLSISEKTAASVYQHPNMNSSAPTLTLMQKNDENVAVRSRTAPVSTKRITFAANLSVYDTFSAGTYDRRSEPATCNHLTPALAQQIKEELNSYKMEEMEVHHASRAHTQFFV